MAIKRPQARAQFTTLSAPVGGWNARDSLAAMPPLDAVTLINYFPATTSVNLRYGYSQHATTFSGYADTIMAYSGAAATKMFAATSAGNIYDTTSAGAVGAAAVSGLSNGQLQYINVATTGGNYLQGVNGSDKAVIFDGTNWHRDGDGSPYNITGVDSAACIAITLHKNRVWLVQKNTLLAWYLPTGAIGGAATSLDLRAFATLGGSLVNLITWTIDAGFGVDDYLAFVTSKGQVIVYQGSDPASSSTWALRGVWNLGSPVGTRCVIKWRGDVLLICQDGLLPLSSALQSSRVNPRVALSNKIQWAVSSSVTNYGSNFGWQILPFFKQNMLILNVPVGATNNQEQYVMNTITGSWAQFQGWNARCWEVYNDEIYFGGNTFVGHAWNTNADNSVAIQGFILQAFNAFGNAAVRKRATAMRPYILSNGAPQIWCGMNWEFDTSNPTSPLTFSPITYGSWDSGVWDSAVWGSDLSPSYVLQGVTGSGRMGAPVFKSASSGIQVQLVSNDVSLEAGGFL